MQCRLIARAFNSTKVVYIVHIFCITHTTSFTLMPRSEPQALFQLLLSIRYSRTPDTISGLMSELYHIILNVVQTHTHIEGGGVLAIANDTTRRNCLLGGESGQALLTKSGL